MEHQQIFSTNMFLLNEFIPKTSSGSQGEFDITNYEKIYY